LARARNETGLIIGTRPFFSRSHRSVILTAPAHYRLHSIDIEIELFGAN